MPDEKVGSRVAEVLAPVRLQELDDRDVKQQRVAPARALVMRSRVLLLDEPQATLGFKLRRIRHEIGATFVS